MRKKVMIVFGTRPEAIKMAPVIASLRQLPEVEVCIVVTAQHRQMLDQVLDLFGIVPDEDLDLMEPHQSLPALFSRVLEGVADVIGRRGPDLVLVHGDTSTALAAALAAFYQRTDVGHVEAGLRTHDMSAPWPEEANRRLTAPLASIHFAPTEAARANLVSEGINPSTIHVTGNSVVDALLVAREKIQGDELLRESLATQFSFLHAWKRLILVTGHRRENFGSGFGEICRALRALARRPDVQIIYPVHLNPNVRCVVHDALAEESNIFLIEPQEYLPFVYLMMRSYLIITDSGGVQEEAPSFAKPVLVMRGSTERPEAVEAETVRLVGTCESAIVANVSELLDDAEAYQHTARAHNPYGDGQAAARIAAVVGEHLASERQRAG